MSESGRLFDVEGPAPEPERDPPRPEGLCVSVVVDLGAVERSFDYVVPPRMIDRAEIGSMVRVPFGGRRIRGWIVALDVEPPAGVQMVEVTRISGRGPDPGLIDLCRWAAWRWAGRLPHFLGTASPPSMVTDLPPASPMRAPAPGEGGASPELVADLVASPRTVLQAAPNFDVAACIAALPVAGDLLIVCPTQRQVEAMVGELGRRGVVTTTHPGGWARAAAGCSVVGTRSAIFAPMPRLGAVVVVDEHDSGHQNEGSPTWHSREIAFERGRRNQVPVILTSPLPTLDARRRARVVTTDRAAERSGWARIDVVDRRDEDRGRTGAFSPALAEALSASESAVVVLNRTGRSALLACRSCRSLGTCAACGSAVRLVELGELVCPRCDARRPLVCLTCGGTAFAQRRWGVSRLRDDLEALLRRPVAELTASGRNGSADATVVVGTEAALHRVPRADTVAFVEFDQELLAPRYRAGEEALALLVRASRLVGGRGGPGRILLQTTEPDHEVVVAASRADPTIFSAVDDPRRELLELPPVGAVVAVGGSAAPEFVSRFGDPEGVTVQRRGDEGWLLRSRDRVLLLDRIAATERPSGRLRLQVDPVRLPFG